MNHRFIRCHTIPFTLIARRGFAALFDRIGGRCDLSEWFRLWIVSVVSVGEGDVPRQIQRDRRRSARAAGGESDVCR